MHRLADLLPDGLIDRADLTAATSPSSVKRWLRRGDVVLVQPGVVALPSLADDWWLRASAATRSRRGR